MPTPISPRNWAPRCAKPRAIGWSPENPGKVIAGEGKHTWSLTPNLSPDGIMLARHAAPSDDGKSAAPVQTLARRAQGRSIWGVLRGDVDNFGLRLRRVHSIEEHVPLSVLYKQFFAGELEVLCSLPEFWRKVSIIYSRRRRFRGLRLLGRAHRAGARGAAPVPPLHRREPEGVSRRRRQDHLDGHRAGAGDVLPAGRRSTKRPAATWTWPRRPTRIASTCWAAFWNGGT